MFSLDEKEIYWSRLVGQGQAEIVFTRLESGRWTRPKPVSFARLDELDVCPSLSADGKYFFFSSDRSGNMDAYWVNAKILEELKKRFLLIFHEIADRILD